MDGVQLSIVFVLLLIAGIVATASVADYWHSDTEQTGPWRSVVKAVSVQRNMSKLLDTSKEQDESLSCLQGMRFYTICWIVVGHIMMSLEYTQTRRASAEIGRTKTFFNQILVNTFILIEIFHFMTGTILSCTVIKKFSERGFRLHYMVLLVIRRALRYMPSLFLVVGFSILLPAFGDGPLWNDLVGSSADNCRKNWLPVVLYANNLLSVRDMCVAQSWYSAVDLQLLLLGTAYLAIYHTKRTAPKKFLILMVVLSIVTLSLVAYINDCPPTILTFLADLSYHIDVLDILHVQPYAHAGSYCVGLALGTFLATSNGLNVTKEKQIVGWLLGSTCTLGTIFLTYIWNSGRHPRTLESVLYAGLSKTVFSLGLAWITLMCAKGKAGTINSFLSWRGYEVLNRLTFLVYIFHMLPIIYYTGMMRGNHDLSYSYAFYTGFGTLVITFLIALVVKLFFEAPISELQNMFFASILQTEKKRFVSETAPQFTVSDNLTDDYSKRHKDPRNDTGRKLLESKLDTKGSKQF